MEKKDDVILQNLKKRIQREEKIAWDRAEYGYDSVCLRIQLLVNELAIAKAKVKSEDGKHYLDFEYWQKYYNQRACRIFEILDDLMFFGEERK